MGPRVFQHRNTINTAQRGEEWGVNRGPAVLISVLIVTFAGMSRYSVVARLEK